MTNQLFNKDELSKFTKIFRFYNFNFFFKKSKILTVSFFSTLPILFAIPYEDPNCAVPIASFSNLIFKNKTD